MTPTNNNSDLIWLARVAELSGDPLAVLNNAPPRSSQTSELSSCGEAATRYAEVIKYNVRHRPVPTRNHAWTEEDTGRRLAMVIEHRVDQDSDTNCDSIVEFEITDAGKTDFLSVDVMAMSSILTSAGSLNDLILETPIELPVKLSFGADKETLFRKTPD